MSGLEEIDNLVIKIPEKQIDALQKRQERWEKINNDNFSDKSVIFKIRGKLSSGTKFASLTLDELSEDMAYLSGFYFHLIEYEGICLAKYTLFKDCYDSNIAFLVSKFSNIYKTKKEAEQTLCMSSNYLTNLRNLFLESKVDLSIIGLLKDSQTTRSDAIKMIIEVYKKRYDSKSKERLVRQ